MPLLLIFLVGAVVGGCILYRRDLRTLPPQPAPPAATPARRIPKWLWDFEGL